MKVNSKKAIKLKNRTKYFDPSTCRTHVKFSSPESYQNRQIKIEGYESRLYWQFRYCQDHNGQTYFYTLTYNNANIPTYLGQNCFDYEDLRDLFTGGFRKQLLRKYGTTFKYFVGAELGDGKGERGFHNNPHYHVLFFLENANNERFPYKVIDPKDFRHLVRLYWQGFDEDQERRDYQLAKYGICKEGENLGQVTDFRACMYCAKYVCKDVKLKQYEKDIERKLRFKYKKKFERDEEFHKKYFYQSLFPMFNVPLNAKRTEWSLNDVDFVERLLPGYCSALVYQDGLFSLGKKKIDEYYQPVIDIVSKNNLWEDYYKKYNEFLDELVHKDIVEYRNRYCNKARISQGVGDYALEFIEDRMNPYIQIPSKKGFKNRPINMYYYRKLYTDVIKDKKGSNLRVINDLGIDYKVNRLDSQINRLINTSLSNINSLVNSKELFDKMKVSDINTSVFISHSDYLSVLNNSLKDNSLRNILKCYAEYKLIYEDRYFKINLDRNSKFGYFPDINPHEDYRRFLAPSVYNVRRSDLRLDTFLESTPENWICYNAHPYFLQYMCIFNVLDMCSDYFFVQKDNKDQKEAEERAATKRFHDRLKLKDYYSRLFV